MYRVEYRTYNGFDNCKFAERSEEADRIASGLSRLKHVSNIRVIDTTQPDIFEDRFMFCATCNFGCRLSQLPEGFALDTDEPDNPWVWCESRGDKAACKFAQPPNAR